MDRIARTTTLLRDRESLLRLTGGRDVQSLRGCAWPVRWANETRNQTSRRLMKLRISFWLLLSTALFAISAAQSAELTIHLDARDVVRKRVHTEMSLEVNEGPLTLVFAKWIPGEHGPTGPLESMVGLQIKAAGKTLSWSRDPLDVYALNVVVPTGATKLDILIETGLAASGEGFSAAPTSSEQLAVLPWNEFVLFPKVKDAAAISTSASLLVPAGWHITSPLDFHSLEDGGVEFESASLATLIDSPTQIGRYMKRVDLQGSVPAPQLRHSISIAADSDAALVTPNDFAAGYSRLVAEAGNFFGTRIYRHYTWLLTLSDHVASFGLEHHEASDDRMRENSLAEADSRQSVAQLLGHEYVHSWNGKFRRPAGLLSPDYQKPMDGSLLWVYEGLTEFLGYVLPTRAGLITQERFREELAVAAGEFDLEPGARWRPLGDTAVAAQVLYPSPAAWSSSRRGVDFYAASEFLWLNVDSELRARTHGRASLDDFAHRFYAGDAGAAQLKPYVESDVYDALAAVAPADWKSIIRAHLDSKDISALRAGLESSGWRLVYTAEKNQAVETGEKGHKTVSREWSIGFRLDEKAEIIDTIEDRPAARAGAGPGMKVVAINGRRYTVEVLDAAMTEAKANCKPIEILVETGDFYRSLSVSYCDGPRFPHLVRVEGKPDTLSPLLKAHAH
jgi:predicted metalloprotease with PDZ domain